MSAPDRRHTTIRISELMIRFRPAVMGRKWIIIDGEKGGTLPDEFDDEALARVAARRAAAEAIFALFEGAAV